MPVFGIFWANHKSYLVAQRCGSHRNVRTYKDEFWHWPFLRGAWQTSDCLGVFFSFASIHCPQTCLFFCKIHLVSIPTSTGLVQAGGSSSYPLSLGVLVLPVHGKASTLRTSTCMGSTCVRKPYLRLDRIHASTGLAALVKHPHRKAWTWSQPDDLVALYSAHSFSAATPPAHRVARCEISSQAVFLQVGVTPWIRWQFLTGMIWSCQWADFWQFLGC